MDGVKRRYLDLRYGFTVMGPSVSLANFIGIAYLYIQDTIPIWVFAPVFVFTFSIMMVMIGSMFRKKQLSTDADLIYERSPTAAMTVFHMMNAQRQIMDHLKMQYPDGFIERLEYMKTIGEKRIDKRKN